MTLLMIIMIQTSEGLLTFSKVTEVVGSIQRIEGSNGSFDMN